MLLRCVEFRKRDRLDFGKDVVLLFIWLKNLGNDVGLICVDES